MDLFNIRPAILGNNKTYDVSKNLANWVKAPVYDWGHIKTAVDIKRPIRLSVIFGSWETERFRTQTCAM
jgi:hypothetical protein